MNEKNEESSRSTFPKVGEQKICTSTLARLDARCENYSRSTCSSLPAGYSLSVICCLRRIARDVRNAETRSSGIAGEFFLPFLPPPPPSICLRRFRAHMILARSVTRLHLAAACAANRHRARRNVSLFDRAPHVCASWKFFLIREKYRVNAAANAAYSKFGNFLIYIFIYARARVYVCLCVIASSGDTCSFDTYRECGP